jgi:uncharacterized protein (DUF4415 family)
MERQTRKRISPPEYGVPDDDIPEMTTEDFRRARPFAEVHPDLAASLRKNRGRPKLPETKMQVTLRLDADVLKKFRAGGPGWQSRINDVLKTATKRRKRA